MKQIYLVLFINLFLLIQVKPQDPSLLKIIVEAGSFIRINTPVSADIEGINLSDTISFKLFEKYNGELIEKPYQVENGYKRRLWWIMDGTTESGKKREYLLIKGEKFIPERRISVALTPETIVVNSGNSEILQYRKAIMYPPENVDTVYKRSGFIHPLRSPSGNIITRVNPPDHYHHMGIWNPWTKVRIADHVSDFWNLYENQGTVRYSATNSLISGPVYGGFSVVQEHIDFQSKACNELVINEVWDVRAWFAEPVKGIGAYLLDFTTFLSLAADSPVVFEAYRYGGGIGIRTNEEWTRNNSTVLTSEGKTRVDADSTRARWVDLNGEFINKSKSGIVFFSHPSNREHPEPMRVWPEDANEGRGDLYFEFCPIRYKEWALYPGTTYRLKYRMLVYDGNISEEIADRLWNDFANPPVVRLLMD